MAVDVRGGQRHRLRMVQRAALAAAIPPHAHRDIFGRLLARERSFERIKDHEDTFLAS
jgi:hypothetical protein